MKLIVLIKFSCMVGVSSMAMFPSKLSPLHTRRRLAVSREHHCITPAMRKRVGPNTLLLRVLKKLSNFLSKCINGAILWFHPRSVFGMMKSVRAHALLSSLSLSLSVFELIVRSLFLDRRSRYYEHATCETEISNASLCCWEVFVKVGGHAARAPRPSQKNCRKVVAVSPRRGEDRV